MAFEAESIRIGREYARREREVPRELYAPWNAAEAFAVAERKFAGARLLRAAGCFPEPGARALEIGCGRIGWLADLISWGLREPDLAAIELDAARAAIAQAALPVADIRAGDAAALPWLDNTFGLVVVSTVFSSILDADLRNRIATEISRVTRIGGAILWYDLRVDNPRNKSVRGMPKSEIEALFPKFDARLERVTLAPPIARAVAPRSHFLHAALGALPFARTHLVGVLTKKR